MYEEYQINPEDSIEWFGENAKKILDRYEGDHGVLVDIGSHVGMVSVLAVTDLGFDMAVAVEPDLENFVHIIDNIAIGDCEGRVLPVWAAIGEGSFEKTQLYTIPVKNKYTPETLGLNSGTHSLVYKENFPAQNVLSLTLGDLLTPIVKSKGSVDFLKIDIEGGEWKLFTEENKDLFRSAKYIDIELHPMSDQYLFRMGGDDLALDHMLHREDDGGEGSVKFAKDYLRSCGFKLKKNPDAFGFYGYNK